MGNSYDIKVPATLNFQDIHYIYSDQFILSPDAFINIKNKLKLHPHHYVNSSYALNREFSYESMYFLSTCLKSNNYFIISLKFQLLIYLFLNENNTKFNHKKILSENIFFFYFKILT